LLCTIRDLLVDGGGAVVITVRGPVDGEAEDLFRYHRSGVMTAAITEAELTLVEQWCAR